MTDSVIDPRARRGLGKAGVNDTLIPEVSRMLHLADKVQFESWLDHFEGEAVQLVDSLVGVNADASEREVHDQPGDAFAVRRLKDAGDGYGIAGVLPRIGGLRRTNWLVVR